jgi:uncharacterized protein
MAPTLANGKICYLELPAVDVAESVAFYREVFRWSMRKRGDGAIAFDDTTGEVSGAFVTGRKAATPGLLFYIMVDRPEITARFRDPGGNIIGLYQQPGGAVR